jgi:hypothetical protein
LRVPVTHAGFAIFARNGMAPALDTRETQLIGAVRLNEAQSDMCGKWKESTKDDVTFRRLADRNLGYPQY